MEWKLSKSRMNYSGTRKELYSAYLVDFYVLYCIENDYVGIIPFEDSSLTAITLRLESPKNNQTKGIKFAKDYELNNLSCIGVDG